VRLRGIGLVLAALAVVASAAAASVQTRLAISGAFQTTSARAVTSGEESCGFRTKARVLIYQSEALRVGRGPAVARVEFLIPHYRGRGRYDPRVPAPYSRTAVQVVTGRNATTGVASGFYIATSGSVSVEESKNVGRLGHSGAVAGTVHARLRLQRGSKRLRLDGSWHCRLDPTSNGG
jgi:hypothetical protein